MGLHPPKPIRKAKERICTQKLITCLNSITKIRIHRHASEFRQSYRSGFAEVGVVSSNLIARSMECKENKIQTTPAGEARVVFMAWVALGYRVQKRTLMGNAEMDLPL